MKRRNMCGSLLVGTIICGMTAAIAVASQPASLIKMKSGDCRFTILESDGLKRVENYNINLRPEDEQSKRKHLELVTTADGTVETTLEAGRYVVDINGSDVAVLQTTAADTTTNFRFVLPENGLNSGADQDTAGLIVGVSGKENATGVIVVNDSLSNAGNEQVFASDDSNGRDGVTGLQRPQRTRTRTRTTGRNTRPTPAVTAPVSGTIKRPFSPSVPPPVSP